MRAVVVPLFCGANARSAHDTSWPGERPVRSLRPRGAGTAHLQGRRGRYFYLERDAALETVEDANGERRTGHRRFEQRAIDAWPTARPAVGCRPGREYSEWWLTLRAGLQPRSRKPPKRDRAEERSRPRSRPAGPSRSIHASGSRFLFLLRDTFAPWTKRSPRSRRHRRPRASNRRAAAPRPGWTTAHRKALASTPEAARAARRARSMSLPATAAPAAPASRSGPKAVRPRPTRSSTAVVGRSGNLRRSMTPRGQKHDLSHRGTK